MAIEPRYSYDPVTQTYRLLTPQEQVQEEQKRGLGALYDSGGANAVAGDPGQIGSGGMLGDVGLGLTGYSEALGGFAPGATVAGIVGGMMADQAIAQNAATDQAIAAANQTNTPVGVTMGAFGPTATTATESLAAMNAAAAQNAQTNANAVSAAQAAQAAQAAVEADVASFADTTDAEAGATVGVSDGGSGGGGDAGGTAGVGDESGHSADGNNSGGGGGDPDGNGTGEGGGWYKGGQIMRYNQGGIADAVKTQSMGRGPDTMLVHMSPKEVQGLQALAMAHGGSLTINPKTGLPEAGFLDSILPMVAGAALTGISGGLINPMTAGLLVGGGTALFTGDLGKGFMAGLGAFGGAGIGAGLAGAGASTTAGQVITPATANATQVAAQPVVSTATSSIAPDSLRGVLMSNGTLAPQAVTPAMNQVIGQQAAQTAVQQAAAAPTMSGMGTGIQNLVTGAPGAGSNFMTAVGGPMGLAKYGGAAAAPLVTGLLTDEGEALPTKTQYIRPYKYDAGRQMDKQGFKYRTGAPGESTSELTYFTPTFTAQPVQTYKDYMSQNMASGGIASMAKGRYLKGHGDGMSDDIPATIEGGQPARLADGEFVVPADVVSHLGNGSSNAGAKKLYKMMDRIRTARTGKTRQAPEVKTEKYMPA